MPVYTLGVAVCMRVNVCGCVCLSVCATYALFSRGIIMLIDAKARVPVPAVEHHRPLSL